ncbi:hypothetical protein C943_01467 [Mariniradius saccharolyticus AK6]|uniref:Uncharacterized protein n=1 Tax=Mariniradius saccharolyticus AK6 TaxID=1239962 RepID=M7X3Z7_9BACT|nr:hypothetical protein C943_01467 [Mariniradius saccharolyticus AK6]
MAKRPAASEKLCSDSTIPPVDGFFYRTKKDGQSRLFHTRDVVESLFWS